MTDESRMSDNTSTFWSGRLICHGHTGWSDPVVYAYDQLERLEIIKSVVSKNKFKNGVALDFGCGTGDFSKLLLKMGFSVCGYDPFVKPSIGSSKFTYASTYTQIPFQDPVVDLVITITAN